MTPPAQPQLDGLRATLNAVRKELLDLGLRNPLLNYRPLKSRGLEVVHERPSDIYRILVGEGKHFSFLPSDGQGSADGGLFSSSIDDEPSGEDGGFGSPGDDLETRYTDTYLQTALTSKQLPVRLLATYYAARTSIEEQGVNTLYLALGMVHWQEDDSSEEVHRAPLVLIPVELERSNVRERFRLKYSGEELGGNASLAEYLRQSFGLDLPELPEAEDLEVGAYFEAVRKATSSQSRWSIDSNAIVLGFFSFSKFLMYRDLDASTWPVEVALPGLDLLNDLLGTGTLGGKGSAYGESDFVDDHLDKRNLFHVVDADSSQTIALLDIADEHSMVVQGPPGTGKSQTIVNAIAEAVAAGKRVLFVSEKMAALEVVKRRLDAIGLGPACLELHSNKTNKKAVIEELRRTMQVREPQMPRVDSELATLGDTRRRLNDYCSAVNLPVANSNETPCSLYGRLLPIASRLAQIAIPDLDVPGIVGWADIDFRRRRDAVATLQARVRVCGTPFHHAFWGSRLRFFLPTQRDRLKQLLLRGADAARRLDSAGRDLAMLLGAPEPTSLQDFLTAHATGIKLATAPVLASLDMRSPDWVARGSMIGQAIAEGHRLREIRSNWNAVLQPRAWDREVEALRRDLAETGTRWWRFLSGRWRAAKSACLGLLLHSQPTSLSRMIETLAAISDAARIRESLASQSADLGRLFGTSWRGDDSDWDLLASQFEWMRSSINAIEAGEVADWCVDAGQRIVDRAALGDKTSVLGLAIRGRERVAGEIGSALELDAAVNSDLGTLRLTDIEQRWRTMAASVAELDSLVAYNQAAEQCRTESLESVVELADRWESAATYLTDLFDHVQISSLLDLAFRDRPALALFDGAEHSEIVSRFRELDRRSLALNRLAVALQHARRVPAANTGNGQIGVLHHEFEKKGRFLPLRKLIGKAGNAIQAIKPVFMMSPLSIANFIPPGAIDFDLVIFDEASQVRPADALGAVVRGRQVVVVGDSKQLPPTSFFDTLVSQEAESDDEELATSDIESILGLFCSRGAHQRMLRWHYRSRHESLIAVSNHLFYDNRLIVFPSPDQERRELGLIYRRLENAPYDRSRTRTNPGEARAVAEAVIAHAREQLRKPEKERLTLGVAAFSVAQMDAILAQVEGLRRANASCEEFFGFNSHEPFFVKNLENVQGDERDVMFISIGYGRTAEGYLAMSFGPLNRAGGERRLNVLITRARERCEVFTTLSADDIDLSRTNAGGALALKTFLTYAATGKIDIPVQTHLPQDSVFEEQVLDALQRSGYTVHAQVGCAGFFLDLAVVDDRRPGRYLLGIECDGAAYHNARSARDRDRLRQTVLEGLNWQIHRIWSTDWFRNPQRELARLIEAIESAKEHPALRLNSSNAPIAAPSESSTDAAETPTDALAESATLRAGAIPKYRTANLQVSSLPTELHLVSPQTLALWLVDVVAVESPVFWLEAARRIASAAGIQRLGNRIQDAFRSACEVGSRAGRFTVRGGFLWRTDMTAPALRDRSDLPQSVKKIEYVAPEEIQAAIERAVRDSYGLAPDDVASYSCRLLGFARITDEMRAVVDKQRDALTTAGRLFLKGDSLVSPVKPN
jgi:very-short-patch-repair endonuclease